MADKRELEKLTALLRPFVNQASIHLLNHFSSVRHRTAGVPAWIEAMLSGSNSSKAMQNVANMVNIFSTHSISDNLQATLAQVFPDVLKGLESLDLDANSTASDVVSALMADPGYVCGGVESVDLVIS